MNPDKKGEEVTDKVVRLSEELMNTPQPFRGGMLMTRPRPGSIEQEGGARESGRPWPSFGNLGSRLLWEKAEKACTFSSKIVK